MPPTVKSLDDRIDNLAADIGDVKSQLSALTLQVSALATQVSSLSSQAAAQATKLDSLIEAVRVSTARMDAVTAKLDTFASDYAAFKAKTETMLGGVRWIGMFVAGVLVTVVVSTVSIAYSAGKLQASVSEQRAILDDVRNKLK
jgi:hypothetical protein